MKVLISFSGGMDSTTVLACALQLGHDAHTVSFTYGSKHNQYENLAAKKIASHYNVSHRLIDLTSVMKEFKSNLLLSGGSIPEGHYEEATMSQTVVPARNLIFCSILAGLAVSLECKQIWLGVHAGDHAIYPDCRPEFITRMKEVIHYATGQDIPLVTPFLLGKKREILQAGLTYTPKVPYHLTRTCYKDQPIACGKCGSCQERLEAFSSLNTEDPIEYESRVILPKK